MASASLSSAAPSSPGSSSTPPVIVTLLNAAVVHLCEAAGYDRATGSALATLGDAFAAYVTLLATSAARVASLAGRSRPTTKDVAKTIDDLGKGCPGESFSSLVDHCKREWDWKVPPAAGQQELEAGAQATNPLENEWITGFLTNGRTRIPSDMRTYDYIAEQGWQAAGLVACCQQASGLELDGEELENGDTRQAEDVSVSPRPAYVPGHLPPMPALNATLSSKAEVHEKGSSVGTGKKRPLPGSFTNAKADWHESGSQIDGEAMQNLSLPEVVPVAHHVMRDARLRTILASDESKTPLTQEAAVAAYKKAVPLSKSRLKDRAGEYAELLRETALRSGDRSSPTAPGGSDPERVRTGCHVSPGRDRTARAMRNLQDVLEAVGAGSAVGDEAATSADSASKSSMEMDMCVGTEIRICFRHASDTLFSVGSSVVDTALLETVLKQSSPHILQLVTPTPLTLVQPSPKPGVTAPAAAPRPQSHRARSTQ